jgi:hypothetical protein
LPKPDWQLLSKKGQQSREVFSCAIPLLAFASFLGGRTC